MADIFISYDHDDTQAMRRVERYLIKYGYTIWTDEGILPGEDDWRDAIEEGIEQSQAVVVILSPEAKESEWVGRELAYAQSQKKEIYPLLARGEVKNAVPLSLINTQFCDIRKGKRGGLKELVDTIKKEKVKPPRRPPSTPPNAWEKILEFAKQYWWASLLVVLLIVGGFTLPSLFKGDDGNGGDGVIGTPDHAKDCEDSAKFIKDVTIPDGMEMQPGETFVKTWRIQNTGDCTWDETYSLVFVSGDQLEGPVEVVLTTQEITKNQQVTISVKLTAPMEPGTYQSNWMLRDPWLEEFGVKDGFTPLWVEIEVVEP